MCIIDNTIFSYPRPGLREHCLGFVGERFPELLPRYERAYAGTYAPREYRSALDARVDRIRARHGFDEDSMRMRRLVPRADASDGSRQRRGRQLALPLSLES